MKVNAFYTVYTIDGKEWESTVEALDEDELYKAGELCRNVKDLRYLCIPTIDAFGRRTSMYFNPEKIVAVRFTEVPV
jgi:hypothetical protein